VISCVIPVRFDYHLVALLQKLATLPELECIVVFNGSPSEFISAIVARFPRCIYYDCSTANKSIARNIGTTMATNEWVWFLDSDNDLGFDRLPDNLLRALRIDELDAIQGNIEFCSPKSHVTLYHRVMTFLKESSTDQLHTPNVFIRRAMLLSVGGFDEAALHGEDFELAVRLNRIGIRTEFFRDLSVVHKNPSTARVRLKSFACYGLGGAYRSYKFDIDDFMHMPAMKSINLRTRFAVTVYLTLRNLVYLYAIMANVPQRWVKERARLAPRVYRLRPGAYEVVCEDWNAKAFIGDRG
jgi:glycosyltransferase involved in cell wall biosynthesis